MISFIVKGTSLRTLVKRLTKSGSLSSHICAGSQRTLFTKNVLLYRDAFHKDLYDVKKQFSEDSKRLGKVIELADNFDEVKVNKASKEEKKNTKEESGRSKHKSASEKRLAVFKNNASKFRTIMMKLKQRNGREKYQKIVLEGKRLIQTALSAGVKPTAIYHTGKEYIEELQLPEGTECYRIPYDDLKLWSSSVTPQGVLGIFNMQKTTTHEINDQSIPLTIVCDNVRDPSNLGSILRVVAGVGCKKVLLMKGCVDMWEPKVLRSAAGAHFLLPVSKNLLWPDVEKEIHESSKVIIADLQDSSSPSNQTSDDEDSSQSKLLTFRAYSKFSEKLPTQCYHSLKYRDEDTVLFIGGETHGLSDQAYNFAVKRNGTKVFIPMNKKVESLNNAVALGIIVYEFRRQYDLSLEEKLSATCQS